MQKHIMFAAKVCKWEHGCRACQSVCPRGAIRFSAAGEPRLDWRQCRDCESFECVAICPNQALKQCVREHTVDELMAILRRDLNHWGAGGGVTFSGGDPLMQPEFVLAALKQCRALQIHTAIETSGYAEPGNFQEIMRYIDFAFIDVKHMDREKHKAGTGRHNDRILANIEELARSGWPGRIVLRQPTIAGYNDDDENAHRLIEFMVKNSLYEINLLKFHRLGLTKWNQLGQDYAYAAQADVDSERLEHLQMLYLEQNIACYIGDSTPF